MRWAFPVLSMLALMVGLAGTSQSAEICIQKPGDPTCMKIITVPEQAAAAMMDKPGVCVITTEVCDGRDNDCDGLIDDGVADLVSGTDVGECQQEIQSCQNGAFVVTQAGIGPTTEVCDGLDNDCNGTVDNGVADLVSGTDVGECQTEIQSCQSGTFVVTQAGIGPSAEVCDGLDNDCNATVDDQATADASCGDGVGCTVDSCVSGSCTNTTNDDLCRAGEVCDSNAGGCVTTAVCPCAAELLSAGWDTSHIEVNDGTPGLFGDNQACVTNGVSETQLFITAITDEVSFKIIEFEVTQDPLGLPYFCNVYLGSGPGKENVGSHFMANPATATQEAAACINQFFKDPAAASFCLPQTAN